MSQHSMHAIQSQHLRIASLVCLFLQSIQTLRVNGWLNQHPELLDWAIQDLYPDGTACQNTESLSKRRKETLTE